MTRRRGLPGRAFWRGKTGWFMYCPDTVLRASGESVSATVTREYGGDRFELCVIEGLDEVVEHSTHDSVEAAKLRAFEVVGYSLPWEQPRTL